ncbi:N-acetylglucosamine-6-phosphate deacetylase [Andreprevotia sp. IGB-42]|uniref:N-acetylglucosamine-6-phosphate deacetylase n=1 Tax=Andreprevotia sp. IGB-42 TaxID=2497473 RepID=UPI00135816F8|nr:N-acetylglucosamine-6-phosphate deacetylase [Andreprevotia sp. IGB-42]KAF0813804.1 N-acetylglucosamine-6-phosphate deacetylase [Andreprevotia sp. IGB-42]
MLSGNILTPDGWRHGQLAFGHGRIAMLGGVPRDPAGNGHDYILPGFIDLHIHGALGLDTMDGATAATRIARLHAQHGTTSLLATTVCTTHEKLAALLAELAGPITRRPANAARTLGVHLEGPYVNPGRLGGLPNEVRPAVLAELDEYMRLVPVKVVTLSPEIAGHEAIIRTLAERGVRVQIGHTLGTYEEGVQALENGVAGFTHLYNAMTPLNHRAPGMVGAALAHAQYSELIPDLIHVHPGAMKVALRSIPKLYCVTDATQTAGLPDGSYTRRGRTVTKCLGAVTLPDGTLAGSALTMDVVLRNLVSLGLSIADASSRISRNPADYLGLADRGRLAQGAWGDAVVLDRDLRVKAVYVEGEAVDLTLAP